jgi:transcriptional regulator with XRE-family HTH domain
MPDPRRTKPARRSPMPEITRIGEAFASRRIQLGLTQQLLADLAGVSRYSVQPLEYGTGSVKLGSILEIAEILGLRLEVSTTDGYLTC